MDGQVELLAVSSSVTEPKIISNTKTATDSIEINRRFSSLNKGAEGSSSIINYDFLVNKNR